MKTVLFIISVLLSSVAISQSQLVKTVFVITKTTPYCGGANPSLEVMEESKKKKIPLGEKFYVIKGWCNSKNRTVVGLLTMDLNGKAITSLKPGCYSIIDSFGYNAILQDAEQYDLDCLKKLWETPLFKFQIKKNKSETFSFNKQELCPFNKPCYKGEVALPM